MGPGGEHGHQRVVHDLGIVVGHPGGEVVIVDLHPAEDEEAEPQDDADPTGLIGVQARDGQLVGLPGSGEVDDGHRNHGQGVGGDERPPPEQVQPGPEHQRAAERKQGLGQDEHGQQGLQELEVEGGGRLQRVARHHQRVVGGREHEDQGRGTQEQDDRPLSEGVEPADAHGLVGDEGGQVVERALHRPPQPGQHRVAHDVVQRFTQEPDREQDGEQGGDQEPDVEHVRVHAHHAVGVPVEEPLLQPALQVVPDEALVRENQGGRQDEHRGGGEGSDRGPHSVEVYSRALVRAPLSGMTQFGPLRRTRPSRS